MSRQSDKFAKIATGKKRALLGSGKHMVSCWIQYVYTTNAILLIIQTFHVYYYTFSMAIKQVI